MQDLWWTKWHWERFYLSTSDFSSLNHEVLVEINHNICEILLVINVTMHYAIY